MPILALRCERCSTRYLPTGNLPNGTLHRCTCNALYEVAGGTWQLIDAYSTGIEPGLTCPECRSESVAWDQGLVSSMGWCGLFQDSAGIRHNHDPNYHQGRATCRACGYAWHTTIYFRCSGCGWRKELGKSSRGTIPFDPHKQLREFFDARCACCGILRTEYTGEKTWLRASHPTEGDLSAWACSACTARVLLKVQDVLRYGYSISAETLNSLHTSGDRNGT